MTNPSTRKSQDRRARATKEIKQLISQRNVVLSEYYALANYKKGNSEPHEITLEMLQEFCQILIDYIAMGHFELYQRIEEGKEQRGRLIDLADQIYPRFSETTQIAVEFNDIFDTAKQVDGKILDDLPAALSKLGEELASRIELEDRFIDSLLHEQRRTEPELVAAN